MTVVELHAQLGKWWVHSDGEVLKMFRRVFLCETKIFNNMALVKSLNGPFCLFRGLIVGLGEIMVKVKKIMKMFPNTSFSMYLYFFMINITFYVW